MIDLSQEKLVPGKTLAKTRDGRTVVFVAKGQAEMRFCRINDTAGSFPVLTNNGMRFGGGRESGEDIVSIAKPWKPKNGDRVSILGYGAKEDWDVEDNQGEEEAVNLTNSTSEITIVDSSVEGAAPEELIVIKRRTQRFLVSYCQIRRYVAPVATLEEPPRDDNATTQISF